MGIIGGERGKRSVGVIGHVIERRNVDPLYFRRFLKVVPFSAAIVFVLFIQVKKLPVGCLAFPNIEHVKKLRKRFRVVGTRASADNDRILLRTLCSSQRNPCKIKHLQNIGIAHFILERNPEEIKAFHCILGFQGKQRDFFLTHDPVQIRPRGIDPLAPHILPAVEHVVKDLDAKMRHANLVDVRKAHGKTDINAFRVFHDTVGLPADVARRFLDL